ncbi:MAG: ABC transporter permease [Phycisphaerales bacterium]
MLTQTLALCLDAYRELNARKLFWITMGLNIMVVVVYASLGINERGVTFWHWTFDVPLFNANLISPELFYKLQFVSWGSGLWLTWVAVILALVSTAGLIPDLISGGVIETVLSKPIGRVRLLLTKYVFGLMFVVLQVFVFSLGCFLVMLIRGDTFVPELFLAVPIVVSFFSFLFCVCVLLGLITRSTVAALLLTFLFWFVIFMVNLGDQIMVQQREQAIVALEDAERNLENQITLADRFIERREEEGRTIEDADGNAITGPDEQRVAMNPALERSRQRVPEAEQAVETWNTWSQRVFWLKTLLPKTGETTGLLERWLISQEDINKLFEERTGVNPGDDDNDGPAMNDPRVSRRVTEVFRSRSLAWVLGTSFAFEFVILGIATLIFVRRDF